MLVHVIRKNGAREPLQRDAQTLARLSFSFLLSFFRSFFYPFFFFLSFISFHFLPPLLYDPRSLTPSFATQHFRSFCASSREPFPSVSTMSISVISVPFPLLFCLSLSPAETLSFAFHCPPSIRPTPTLCLSRFFSHSASILWSMRTSKRACASLQSLANRRDRTLCFHRLPSSFPFLLPVNPSLGPGSLSRFFRRPSNPYLFSSRSPITPTCFLSI